MPGFKDEAARHAHRKALRAAAQRVRRSNAKAARDAAVERKRAADCLATIPKLGADDRTHAAALLMAELQTPMPSSALQPSTLAVREQHYNRLTGNDREGQDAYFYHDHPDAFVSLGRRIGMIIDEPIQPAPASAVASRGAALSLAVHSTWRDYERVRSLFPQLQLPTRRSLRPDLARLSPQGALMAVPGTEIQFVFVSLHACLVYDILQWEPLQEMEGKTLVIIMRNTAPGVNCCAACAVGG